MSLKHLINQLFISQLEKMAKHPELITDEQREKLEKTYNNICKTLGISENGKWVINWKVDKFYNKTDYENNTPYETATSTQNIILNNGANEMLKIICGIDNRPAYSNSNAKIQVGTSSSPENASQTGLIATSPNMFEKSMEPTYPQVSGRTMVFKAVFDDGEANFVWNEFSITNGAINMNRKVQNLGTKNGGVWSIQITISVTSA